MSNSASKHECEHKYTFKKEELYQSVNTIFSKKICEKCGKEIVLSKKSRITVVLFTFVMVLLIVLIPRPLKTFLPDISYLAKAMVVVFAFCGVYGFGLYRLMNSATYVPYEPSETSHRYRDAYEKARKENDERTRQRYEEAARRREQRREQKAEEKATKKAAKNAKKKEAE